MQKIIINTRLLVSGLVISSVLGGCASTVKVSEKDPWEDWNRGAQEFNDGLDKTIIKPVAKGYSSVIPEFVNDGAANFFSNLSDIGVTVNDLLQLKMAQGGMDASRFLINTTTGIAGFVDVAKMIDLPKHNEDFGQTLGFWGVPSGNYLVVPFLGASSPREVVGVLGDALMNPLTYTFVFAGSGAIFKAILAANSPRQVVGILGNAVGTAVMDPLTYTFAFSGGDSVFRATNEESQVVDLTDTDLIPPENVFDEASIDRYDFIKNVYQQRRKYLVHDGNVPDEDELQLADEATTEDTNTEQIGTNYGRARKHYQHMFISP